MVSRETMAVYQIDEDAPALNVFLILTSHAQSLENAATLTHQVASHYEMNNAFGRNCTRLDVPGLHDIVFQLRQQAFQLRSEACNAYALIQAQAERLRYESCLQSIFAWNGWF